MGQVVTLLSLLLSGIEDPKKPPSSPPTGLWMGTLNIMLIQKLRLVLEIAAPAPGKLVATVDSIDQGTSGICVDTFASDGSKMEFEIKQLKATYRGELKPDGKFHGTFKQGGLNLPLVLERINERPKAPPRDQDPKKPYPYAEEEVKIVNRAPKSPITLAGTLTLPKTNGPHPAVVLITGSGAQNRNEELLNHRPFLVLADHLTRKGVAVLRLDDRGVGGSSKGSKNDTSKDFATDIRAAVDHLLKDSRIDAKRIGLVGHSEGGMIAPMVAADAPDDVAFIVLLAGPMISGGELLQLQGEKILRANGASASDATANRELQRRLFAILRSESDQKKVVDRLDQELNASIKKLPGVLRTPLESEQGRRMQIGALNSPWMKFFLEYDPIPALQTVRCPVLAVWGEKDLQVPPTENIDALKKAIPDWESRKITLQVFPSLNHLFQTCGTGSPLEYQQLPETFSPTALGAVSAWIVKYVGTKQ
jgi:uncharacterized protein